MDSRVLLLNVDYSPLEAISWERAIELLLLEKAEMVEELAGRVIRSAARAFPFPSVIRLVGGYVRRRVRPSRENVFARDGYACQYCGARGSSRTLTIDHVVPRAQSSRGKVRTRDGQVVSVNSWHNKTTACGPCNHRKADRTPAEAGMVLRRYPEPPSVVELARRGLGKDLPQAWRFYLG